MGTRESRRQRGRRLGEQKARGLIAELRSTRLVLGLSQQSVAEAVGRSQAEISRFEGDKDVASVTLVEIAEVATVLGLELSVGLHPAGAPIRDKGQQALIGRLRLELAPSIRVGAEVGFPNPGDPRTWDLVIAIRDQRVGVEAETRIRDVQALSRRMHQRERDGGVGAVLLVLSDSVVNRRLVGELRVSLGPAFGHSPRAILRALRAGDQVPGSGVLLL
ncbi:MAG TPA: helix-turn-helix transcriptional regulator [Candidatus Limnocylindrales bacterium]